MKELLSRVRAAVDRFDMIPDGSDVAVGVSGGKDSLAVLAALDALRGFYPNRFTLTALTADPCFFGQPEDYSAIERWCSERDIPYVIRRTRLYEIVFVERAEKNACSLCSRMRRGILHRMAKENGCGVLALGHHSDDAIETLMLNLLCGGHISGMSPKTYLDRSDITLIRPLIFCDEKLCSRTASRLGLPVVKSRCPADGLTERRRMRELIEQLEERYPDLRAKLEHANMEADGM